MNSVRFRFIYQIVRQRFRRSRFPECLRVPYAPAELNKCQLRQRSYSQAHTKGFRLMLRNHCGWAWRLFVAFLSPLLPLLTPTARGGP